MSPRSLHLDYRLQRSLEALIASKHYDSAIRQAFVFFKTAICRKFSIDEEMDGERLITMLFGGKSTYFSHLSPGMNQSYRDLYAGIFGILRNSYMHNFREANALELECVLSNVNYGLHLIGDFHLKECDVILIEEEDRIAQSLAEVLLELNLSIRTFESFCSAVAYIEDFGTPILVVTERVIFSIRSPKSTSAPIPESALNFVSKVRKMDTDIPVILTSDYRAKDEPTSYEHIACYKPFTMEYFRDLVARTYQRRVRELMS